MRVTTVQKSVSSPLAKRGNQAATRPSDESLLERYRDFRDRDAFDELVRRYERELYAYLRRYLGDATLAEDVSQATFLQLHQKAHLYQNGRTFRPWLYTIATHQAIDFLRKMRRHPTVSLDVEQRTHDSNTLSNSLKDLRAEPPVQLEQKEQCEWARNAVDQLPEHLRRVLVLTYYEGMKYREISKILGIPVGTVKWRMHTALGRLGACWRRRRIKEGAA